MSLRAKTKRRLSRAAACGVLFVGLAAAACALRARQVDRRLLLGRAEGAAALAAGNYELALQKLGPYVRRHGNDADPLYQYAQARERVPDPEGKHVAQAISLYRQFLALRPGHAEARRRLLGLYVDYGFNAEALEAAVALDPAARTPGASTDRDVLRAQARVLARLRRYADAYDAANAYNARVPRDLDMQWLTLKVLLARGNPATDAVERASALQKQHPGDPVFELLLGIAHRAAGDVKDAGQWVAQAAASPASGDDPTFIKTLVEQLEALGRFDESLRVLARAADAGIPQNRRLLATRLWQAGRFQQLVVGVEPRLSGNNPDDAEVLALRAMALFELKRTDEAAAIVRALDGRVDAASEAWAPVLKAVFGAAPVSHKQAVRACSDACGRLPSNPYFHQFLADAWSALGERDLALSHWARAAQLSPSWAAPRVSLARALASSARPADSVKFAREALKLRPGDVEVLRTASDALAGALAAPATGEAAAARSRYLAELRETLAALDALCPDDGAAVPAHVLLSAAEGRRDEAAAASRAALDASRTYSDTTYLSLASVSRAFGLGVEDLCLARCEQAQGRVSPALAATRARAMLVAGKAGEGKRLLEAARAAARDAAEIKGWRTAWATYLDAAGDPGAMAALVSLAEDFADDAPTQALALRAAAARRDREFLDRTIQRLRAATGEDGVGWRVARARWLAAGAAGDDRRALTEAALMLGGVCRNLPDLPEPRLLLARCLTRLGNAAEAIEQLTGLVNANPDAHGASLELARLLQANGDYAAARPHLDRVAGSGAAPVADRVAAGSLLARGGDTGRALLLMQQLRRPGATGAGEVIPTRLLAELYWKQGDPGEAKAICGRLLDEKLDPDVVGLLADILAAEGDTQQADQVLAKLDGSDVPPPQKDMVRGRHYSARGDHARALAQFKAATRGAPASADAWRMLANQHLAGARLEEALASARAAAAAGVRDAGLQALQRLGPTVPRGPDGVALVPLLAGVVDNPADEQAAAEVLALVAGAKKDRADGSLTARLREVADRHPRSMVVQNIAARACASQAGGRGVEMGLAIATRAMQNFPDAAEPAEAAAAALAALARWDDAIAVARQWKQRCPSAAGADLVTASGHLAMGRPQQALAALEPHVARGAGAGAQSDGDREKSLVTRATILYAQALVATGKAADAETLLAGRVRQSPQYRVAWINIASRQLPDVAAAARWLEAAERSAPRPALTPRSALAEQAAFAQRKSWPARTASGERDDVADRTASADRAALTEAWLALGARSGVAAYRERGLGMLAALTKQTLGRPDASGEELLSLALLCESGADNASAEVAYRRALAKDSENPVAMNNLAMLLTRRGEAAEAEVLALRAAGREHPRRASFLDTLATAQAALKKWPDAVKAIQAARDLEPANLGFQIHQAAILSAAGDRTRAREAFGNVSKLQCEDGRLGKMDRDRLVALRKEFGAS